MAWNAVKWGKNKFEVHKRAKEVSLQAERHAMTYQKWHLWAEGPLWNCNFEKASYIQLEGSTDALNMIYELSEKPKKITKKIYKNTV